MGANGGVVPTGTDGARVALPAMMATYVLRPTMMTIVRRCRGLSGGLYAVKLAFVSDAWGVELRWWVGRGEAAVWVVEEPTTESFDDL